MGLPYFLGQVLFRIPISFSKPYFAIYVGQGYANLLCIVPITSDIFNGTIHFMDNIPPFRYLLAHVLRNAKESG